MKEGRVGRTNFSAKQGSWTFKKNKTTDAESALEKTSRLQLEKACEIKGVKFKIAV